ncbi:MAG: helix-turn-helix transcriptional regulator [Rubrivivax sp.]|nr:helix-turn-helix transcriptional regulator [Rubrivivax sp.]
MHMDTLSPLFPAPPSAALRFRSDDLDQVRAFMRSFYDGEHSRVAHRSAALGFDTVALRGSTLWVGWTRAAVEKTIRGAVNYHLLYPSVPAGSRYCFGRHQHATGTHTATFVAAGWEFSRRSPPGETLSLAVHAGPLSDEIAARQHASRGHPVLQSRALELDVGARARLADAVTSVAGSAAADGVPSPHDEARLLAVIADILLAGSAVQQAHALDASRLAAVEAWIDAHLEEPITVGRLCEVAGVGERALQKAFESHRGLSPMRFVVERRLASARRLLESADPHGNVTDIAMRLGFHLGRFARLYRDVFGEAPSQTLYRARR